jgi:small subunit ribosomal protein S6
LLLKKLRRIALAENAYEGLFIFDSNRYARDPAGVSGQIATLIGKHHGKILASRLWEERRLAYPINGQRKGTYWLTYFHLDSLELDALRGDLRINDGILRELILKVDPRIIDALVTHAQSATEAAKPRRAPAPAAAAPAAAAPAQEVEVPEEAE